MNKFIELLVGLVFLLVPIYLWLAGIWNLGNAAALFFEGGLMWLVILIGIIMILVGISDIKG